MARDTLTLCIKGLRSILESKKGFRQTKNIRKAELNRSNISFNMLDEMLDECWINVA